MSPRRILIVGGSTRAAADSVRRAGWHPICADLFADLDLRMTADIVPVKNYPHSLPDDVANVCADGWFYCGALENHPEILSRIDGPDAPYGPLLGTSPEALKFVRDPHWLVDVLTSHGMNALEVATQTAAPNADGTWVQKPVASAGGRSIRIWDETAFKEPFREPHYFQRRANGFALSAIFDVQNRDIEWIGGSKELDTQHESLAPSPFSYCGSCGPLKNLPLTLQSTFGTKSNFRHNSDDCHIQGAAIFSAPIQQQLDLIAKTLVNQVGGLRGLIGLDFRLDGDTVWLTEVNPRYTASVEVLELASRQSFLNQNAGTHPKQTNKTAPLFVAKQILYASKILKCVDLSRFATSTNPWQIPKIADIPVPDSIVEPGWPICTVFASGTKLSDVENNLRHESKEVRGILDGDVLVPRMQT